MDLVSNDDGYKQCNTVGKKICKKRSPILFFRMAIQKLSLKWLMDLSVGLYPISF